MWDVRFDRWFVSESYGFLCQLYWHESYFENTLTIEGFQLVLLLISPQNHLTVVKRIQRFKERNGVYHGLYSVLQVNDIVKMIAGSSYLFNHNSYTGRCIHIEQNRSLGTTRISGFLQNTFSNVFFSKHTFLFWFKFHLTWLNSLIVTTGSGNDLAPKRHHAITCTNDNPIHWHIS